MISISRIVPSTRPIGTYGRRVLGFSTILSS